MHCRGRVRGVNESGPRSRRGASIVRHRVADPPSPEGVDVDRVGVRDWPQSVSCLDENDALKLIEGRAGEAAERWRRHIGGCEACRVFVASLARVLMPEFTGSVGGWRSVDAELPAGTTVGNYVVGEILGRGGMGCVYAARDVRLARDVALKLLHGRDDGQAMSRLRTEAKVMASLSHPNIAVIYDVGHSEFGGFVAMERIDGQDLRRWRESPRSIEDVLAAYLQAGRGLSAAHDAGVVHRDFKPSNAMIGRDGRVRVLDFGLARMHDAGAPTEQGQDAAGPSPGHASHAVLGTPAYASPEQVDGAVAGPESDQFSYCVALFEALCGTRPFDDRSPRHRRRSIEGRRFEAWSAEVPRHVREAVDRGLRVEPDRRHRSMAALLSALERPRRSRWGVVLAAGAVVGGGLVATWGPSAEPCDDGVGAMTQAWSARRDPSWDADPTMAATVRRVDEFVASWLSVRAQACSTRASDVDAFEGQAACLERLTARLDRVGARLGQAAERSSPLPSNVLAGLEDPVGCLEGRAAASVTSVLAEEFEAVQEDARDLEVRGLLRGEERDRIVDRVTALLVRAEEVGDSWVQAELSRKLGTLALLGGDLEESLRRLEEAYFVAGLARDAKLQLAVAESLVIVAAYHVVDPELAEYWSRRAVVAARELGTPEARATATVLRGMVALVRADATTAVDAFDAALMLIGDDESFVLLPTLLQRRGQSLMRLSRVDEAGADFERALVVLEHRLGPMHPLIAGPVSALATVAMEQERYEDAVELTTRAIELTSEEDQVGLAYIRANLGLLYRKLERYDEALQVLQTSLETMRTSLGTRHPVTLRTTVDVAYTLLRAEQAPAAAALLDGVLVGDLPRHFLSDALLARAQAREAVGRTGDAVEDYRAILRDNEASDYELEAAREQIARLETQLAGE